MFVRVVGKACCVLFLLVLAFPSAQAGELRAAGVTRMQLLVEPYQAAFYLLLPEHWRAEGGMRPSGVAWNRHAVTDNDAAASQLQQGGDWRPLQIIHRNAR